MRRIWRYVLTFALVYGAAVAVAQLLPVYDWIEVGVAAAVDASLDTVGDGAQRSLRVDLASEPARYRYRVAIASVDRTLGGPIHPHGFVLLVFLGLVLSTPGLSWSRRALGAVLGGALSFGLCAAMLMFDVQRLEARSFGDGPYGAWIEVMHGVHGTAAGAIVPLVLWGFFAGPRLSAPPSPKPTRSEA